MRIASLQRSQAAEVMRQAYSTNGPDLALSRSSCDAVRLRRSASPVRVVPWCASTAALLLPRVDCLLRELEPRCAAVRIELRGDADEPMRGPDLAGGGVTIGERGERPRR